MVCAPVVSSSWISVVFCRRDPLLGVVLQELGVERLIVVSQLAIRELRSVWVLLSSAGFMVRLATLFNTRPLSQGNRISSAVVCSMHLGGCGVSRVPRVVLLTPVQIACLPWTNLSL
ncbi:hypothetical protein AALO_G00020490 [Alosa alosa]|uniref:Secreted protein n=1 Tax=Alosa alosa TaxID=278164 RepID=A0AAV6H9K3_9TELE|nr:hypothetical protein AALO_G00020490 [Alosa alosa]